MLELYHSVNSVCAQKVRVVLAEEGLEYREQLMTRADDQFDPEYMKLNPNAVVPTLVHDGRPVIESSVILYYLDEVFPQPPLISRATRTTGRSCASTTSWSTSTCTTRALSSPSCDRVPAVVRGPDGGADRAASS